MDNEAINRVVTGVGYRILRKVLTVVEILLSLHLVDVRLISTTPGDNCCQLHSFHTVALILEIFEVPGHHNNTTVALA